ncbi:MAG: hypothetical protein K6E51_02945 [Treponema sp.]|nr:hypothetical protein [Treponema sp.]
MKLQSFMTTMVLGIVSLGLLSCSNVFSDNFDSDSTSARAAAYVVGSDVTFEGGNYRVISNDFASSESRAVSTSEVESGITRFKNDSAMSAILSEYAGINNKVVLFNRDTKGIGKDGYAYIIDEYLILDRDAAKVAKFRYKWQSTTIKNAQHKDAFEGADIGRVNTAAETTIRNSYDPDHVQLYTYSGGDEQSYTQLTYTRDSNNKCSFASNTIKSTSVNSVYATTTAGIRRALLNTTTYNSGDVKVRWSLSDVDSKAFFAFVEQKTDGSYSLTCRGDGLVKGSANADVYYCTANITSFVEKNNLGVSFTRKKNNGSISIDSSQYIQAVDKGSDGTITQIMVICPFEDTSATLNAYSRTIFKWNGSSYVWEGAESFANRYAKNYTDLSTVNYTWESVSETYTADITELYGAANSLYNEVAGDKTLSQQEVLKYAQDVGQLHSRANDIANKFWSLPCTDGKWAKWTEQGMKLVAAAQKLALVRAKLDAEAVTRPWILF